MNINYVVLGGNLTRDPELRYTTSGAAVCNFGIASNEKWTDKDGQKQERVTFVDVEVWKKSAEAVAEHLKKGNPAVVEGRLKFEQWEKDGQKRSKLKVTAIRVHFVGGGGTKRNEGEAATKAGVPAHATSDGAEPPPDWKPGDAEETPF